MLDFLKSLYDPWPLRIFLWVIAAIYAMGATVHVKNMLGLSGQPWMEMPVSWRVFDIVFLVLNLIVLVGVLLRSPWGIIAFLTALALQLVLYIGMPGTFSTNEEERAALRGLVQFHLVTLALFAGLVGWKIWLR